MLKDVRREAEHACRVWTALKYCRSPANNVVGRILEGFVFEGSGLSYSYLITNPNTISYHNNLSLTMFGMDHYSLCVLLRDRFLFVPTLGVSRRHNHLRAPRRQGSVAPPFGRQRGSRTSVRKGMANRHQQQQQQQQQEP